TGTSFTFRDPWGIRSAFWYKDDEIAVVASERPVIQTVFNVPAEKVIELLPGQGLIFHKDGRMETSQIHESKTVKACSFERIYFSRGSDKDIYRERKALGKALVPEILRSIHKDLEHTVFSFIPNTAEVAFYGMKEGLDQYLNEEKAIRIMEAGSSLSPAELHNILSKKIRMEKVAIKDIKLRTFITEDKSRDELTAHVYDITYESIVPGVDNLVVIDDSIVRGTTLKQSIIKILDRLEPRKIVIVSSSPQVRYPDCYGIDMSRMEEFIAFKAAVALLKESGRTAVLESVYLKALRQRNQPKQDLKNYVREIYEPFTPEEISEQIVKMLTPENIKAEVEIVYQSIDGLHKAIPNHKGDWYFSGEYPTPGGYKAVNEAFINFYEGVNQRPV
ncbi:MAG: amidophosphoribosyltransferase, partial [Bacteroidales bacterium]|nr:amidophosphoribosyltransferase [Bacteroidales bacterium]